MKADTRMSDDFGRCADFHGHVCPGLAIGYQAAKAGIAWLAEHRAKDEEIVAIVETNACGTDAVQVLTGCTFGKGNLIHKDHGKQVFTFISRGSGKGVRIAMQPGVIELGKRHQELLGKVMDESVTDEEREEFWAMHRQKSQEILQKPAKELFTIKAVDMTLPNKATIEPSITCGRCGEPTMASKVADQDGLKVCRDCLA